MPGSETDLAAFLAASPSALHAALEAERRLLAAGFQTLDAREPRWGLGAGRYLLRRSASLVAFTVRGPGFRRLRLLAAHTDSPHLALKPRPAYACEGCLQLGVEPYGSALWNSWLDRDLGLAGSLALRDGRVVPVHVARPLARIPQLAIHLDRTVNEQGLKLNPQLHLAPLWGLAGGAGEPGSELMGLLAAAAGVPGDAVLGFDLQLCDLAAPARLGLAGELLSSGRLDNQASCQAGVAALVAAAEGPAESLPVLALFDHEEVGSQSAEGADGVFAAQILERVAIECGLSRSAWLACLAGSLAISADMAHAIHPNHPERHDPRHHPRLGGGPVLKSNANRRYATDAAAAAQVRACAGRANLPLQDFCARSDLGCGSTIGPSLAAGLGLAVADVGAPMLSMHSARELMAVDDQAACIALYTELLRG